MERFFLAAMARAGGVGSRYLCRMLDFAPASALWQMPPDELAHMTGIPGRLAEAIHSFRKEHPQEPERLQELCGKSGVSVCDIRQEEYPSLLKEISDPPAVLFYRGELQPEAVRLAVVGSRRMSPYGEGVASELAQAAAQAGITVVSGAARGIDTAAHTGGLKSGRTVAVLGCGVDVAYPSENRALLEKIAEQGAVVSEYAPGTKPLPAFFPARNRIISGLCRTTLVVEAAERSGSLITAELALSEGRDVLAVPGSIYSKNSRGCHHLIQQGAKLVASADDVLEEYGMQGRRESKKPKRTMPELTEEESMVYRVLSADHPLSVDEVIYSLHGASVSNVAFLLLQLQLKGCVIENEMHAYLRAERV